MFDSFDTASSRRLTDSSTIVTTGDMIFTLWVNLLLFIIFMLVFEFTRHIKQVFLKRFQRRFEETNRVPPLPPKHLLGWLVAIFRVSEEDVYKMVGLDAYILLRYHVVCIKYCVFLSVTGFLILIPINVSATAFLDENWDRYTISNVMIRTGEYKRLWFSVIFSYIYAGYFCKLLYKEYYHFALKRLDYLVQRDVSSKGDTSDSDPDTPMQTYFTVMVERIPAHLRSASALREYFDKLFPGDVNCVEVAMDLGELSSLIKKRTACRDSLEKAVALFEVTGRRSKVFVCTYNENSYFLGYEFVDSIAYYTFMLRSYNTQVAVLQEHFYLKAQTMDVTTQKKLKNKLDTRAARLMEGLSKGVVEITKVNSSSDILFGSGKKSKSSDRRKSQNPVAPIPFDLNATDENSVINPILESASSFSNQDSPQMKKKDIPAPSKIEEEEGVINNDPNFNKTKIFGVQLSDGFKNKLKEKAQLARKEVIEQAKEGGKGAIQGVIEAERLIELLVFGAYYKTSSTAFVTFNSRVTKICAQKLLLSDDGMEIKPAPNPKIIIWDNVSIPRSQVDLRRSITNLGVTVGSLFWSTLVSSINYFATFDALNLRQQNLLSVFILLALILMLPFIFDFLARYYEGMKLESEIQNSIMFRYFYYQVVNVYVTVGCAGIEITKQITDILQRPATLEEILGIRIPGVSLFFCNLVILKIFVALPLEMLRPPILLGLVGLGSVLDKRTSTRREFRTGAFDEYPMLYGWVYPQILFVLMIMQVYCCIAPLLIPFGIIFFCFSYAMYKYQLLYVYVNEYQSGGDMWYDVFWRSLVGLVFATFTLLGYLMLQISLLSGPFIMLLPLPLCILYFWRYCEGKFRAKTQSLSLDFAKGIDLRNCELKAQGKPIPHDKFTPKTFRQPELWEPALYPEPYRRLRTADEEAAVVAGGGRARRGSLSINPLESVDDVQENDEELKEYFEGVVQKMADKAVLPPSLINHVNQELEDLLKPSTNEEKPKKRPTLNPNYTMNINLDFDKILPNWQATEQPEHQAQTQAQQQPEEQAVKSVKSFQSLEILVKDETNDDDDDDDDQSNTRDHFATNTIPFTQI